jgi:hypothetical protein
MAILANAKRVTIANGNEGRRGILKKLLCPMKGERGDVRSVAMVA